jgi:hypothetical protein
MYSKEELVRLAVTDLTPDLIEQFERGALPLSPDNELIIDVGGIEPLALAALSSPFTALMIALRNNTTITTLELRNNATITTLELRNNATITTLDLPRLPYSYVDSVCGFLHHNTTLQHLNLAGSWLGNTAVVGLCDAIRGNPRTALTTLNLSGNLITPIGAGGIARMLRENNSLVSLDLQNNFSLYSEGVGELADALKSNNHLASLNIGCCHIEGSCFESVTNPLAKIDIGGDTVPDGLNSLISLLKERQTPLKLEGIAPRGSRWTQSQRSELRALLDKQSVGVTSAATLTASPSTSGVPSSQPSRLLPGGFDFKEEKTKSDNYGRQLIRDYVGIMNRLERCMVLVCGGQESIAFITAILRLLNEYIVLHFEASGIEKTIMDEMKQAVVDKIELHELALRKDSKEQKNAAPVLQKVDALRRELASRKYLDNKAFNKILNKYETSSNWHKLFCGLFSSDRSGTATALRSLSKNEKISMEDVQNAIKTDKYSGRRLKLFSGEIKETNGTNTDNVIKEFKEEFDKLLKR